MDDPVLTARVADAAALTREALDLLAAARKKWGAAHSRAAALALAGRCPAETVDFCGDFDSEVAAAVAGIGRRLERGREAIRAAERATA